MLKLNETSDPDCPDRRLYLGGKNHNYATILQLRYHDDEITDKEQRGSFQNPWNFRAQFDAQISMDQVRDARDVMEEIFTVGWDSQDELNTALRNVATTFGAKVKKGP